MAPHNYSLPLQVALIGVVDDDPAVRNSLKFSLEVEGFTVRGYASAEDLLKEPDLAGFACLVIDQHMPGMSGIELVAAMRERRIAVPVILITTHPSRVLINLADRLATPIVEKPLLGNSLLEKIRDAAGTPMGPRLG